MTATTTPTIDNAAGSQPLYIDQATLALRWGFDVRTLQRWRQTGTGPRYLQFGRLVRYRLDDILAFENRMCRGGEAGE